jgi:PAS domain S-box-containing protein
MERRQYDRLPRPGRRQSDRRTPAFDNRRVLLIGPDEAWRSLASYVFEEAGYVVYTAADLPEAMTCTIRLLPDVVVVQMERQATLDILARLPEGSGAADIPIVVVTTSLHSDDAQRAREAGGIVLLAHAAEVDVLVGEVDTLIASPARAQRMLKRRLLEIRELARFYRLDDDGQARFSDVIGRLEVAIFAIDGQGHCIAASQGASMLTGYSRPQLLTASVFHIRFAGGQVSDERWQGFLSLRQYAGTTTITNRAGEEIMVHAAAAAEIMPGFHVAALVAA